MAEEKPLPSESKQLLPGAVHVAVLKETLQPLTLFPVSVGGLGLLSMVLLDPTFISPLIMLGGFGLGAGNWVINYFFRYDIHAQKYLSKVYAELLERRKMARQGLELELAECAKFAGDLAKRARDQLPELIAKFNTFREILSKKLNEGELTYSRIFNAAEQVYFATIDNLRDVVNMLKTVRSIGTDYEEQLKRLDPIKTPTEAEKREKSTLLERKELRESQLKKVRDFLALNEEAMTKIDVMTAGLVGTKTVRGEASLDIETAMRDLQELAERMHQYSIKS